MPIKLTPEDLRFLQRVEELGATGLSQDQIAERLDFKPGSFRNRIRDLGFHFVRRTELEARPHLGGKSFAQMVEDGEIILANPIEPAHEPVPVTA